MVISNSKCSNTYWQFGSNSVITRSHWPYVANDGVEVVGAVDNGTNKANGYEKIYGKLECLRDVA